MIFCNSIFFTALASFAVTCSAIVTGNTISTGSMLTRIASVIFRAVAFGSSYAESIIVNTSATILTWTNISTTISVTFWTGKWKITCASKCRSSKVIKASSTTLLLGYQWSRTNCAFTISHAFRISKNQTINIICLARIRCTCFSTYAVYVHVTLIATTSCWFTTNTNSITTFDTVTIIFFTFRTLNNSSTFRLFCQPTSPSIRTDALALISIISETIVAYAIFAAQWIWTIFAAGSEIASGYTVNQVNDEIS